MGLCRDKDDDAWYTADCRFSTSKPVHSIAVSSDTKVALAGDPAGFLTPIDLESYSSHKERPLGLPAEDLGEADSDKSCLPLGIYNPPTEGNALSVDAVSLRPILAVLGENGWIKYVYHLTLGLLDALHTWNCSWFCRHDKRHKQIALSAMYYAPFSLQKLPLKHHVRPLLIISHLFQCLHPIHSIRVINETHTASIVTMCGVKSQDPQL